MDFINDILGESMQVAPVQGASAIANERNALHHYHQKNLHVMNLVVRVNHDPRRRRAV